MSAGHAQLRVSRRITASVDAHWQQSAKNTISDSATATGYLPRTGSVAHSSRIAPRSDSSSSSPFTRPRS